MKNLLLKHEARKLAQGTGLDYAVIIDAQGRLTTGRLSYAATVVTPIPFDAESWAEATINAVYPDLDEDGFYDHLRDHFSWDFARQPTGTERVTIARVCVAAGMRVGLLPTELANAVDAG